MSDVFETGPRIPVETVFEGARNLGELFRRRADKTPDGASCYEKRDGAWRKISWGELQRQAARAAAGLVDLGVEIGERIAILGPTHVDWCVWDLGGHLAGLVTVGVYPKQSADQVRYLLEHSESRVIFVDEEDELRTVLEAARGNDHLQAIVPWSEALAERFADADARIVSPASFRARALSEAEISSRLDQVAPEDTALLIYTSGTTGPPKGAMISHGNVLALLATQPDFLQFYQDDRIISFLPMAHATERVLAFYGRLNTGVAAAYATHVGTVLDEMREIRPTIFGSVPRLFEKAYAKVQSGLAQKPAPVRALFDWAVGVGRRRSRYLFDGRPVPATLELLHKLAHLLVFRKIHAAFGGRVRVCLTGAAPISNDILEFFWAIGMPIHEAYGMTEATVATHVIREGAVKLGTVGQVVRSMECRIADDGEVLLRGPLVFQGYYKNEDATRETIRDGWLHTGDVGQIDDEGFLRITDRKKHLIITAGGKNVAPANIERAIKDQSPLISQVHAHGDRRSYICALIAPSPLETLDWGAERGLLDRGEVEALGRELQANPTARSEALGRAMAKVVAEPDFRALFVAPVERGNRALARVERVRRFFLLDRDLSQEAGELTPTMKVKRKAIEDKYSELFDRVYSDPDFAVSVEPAGA